MEHPTTKGKFVSALMPETYQPAAPEQQTQPIAQDTTEQQEQSLPVVLPERRSIPMSNEPAAIERARINSEKNNEEWIVAPFPGNRSFPIVAAVIVRKSFASFGAFMVMNSYSGFSI